MSSFLKRLSGREKEATASCKQATSQQKYERSSSTLKETALPLLAPAFSVYSSTELQYAESVNYTDSNSAIANQQKSTLAGLKRRRL